MTMIRFISLGIFIAVAAAASGCTANQVCAQRQECNDSLEDDSQNVCVAAYNAEIDRLRANSEEECHRLADAILAADNCLLQLDCNDLDDGDDREDACGDELDDVRDARDDADNECSSTE
jgi:hypothetical protein